MAKENVTIKEDFELPSKGLIYGKPFDPRVTIRSMTVEDEMKRLSPSNNPYKNMSEIIESCLLEKLPISVYDLCIGDYTYLLYKLRTVTYGSDYKMRYMCPKCGSIETAVINLDDMKINEYNDKIKELLTVELPQTNHVVELRFQTPRDLDRISSEAKKMKDEFPEMIGDPALLLTLQSLIKSIDGNPVDPIMIKESLKKLPMKDTNILTKKATKLNDSIGVSNTVKIECTNCKETSEIPFRFTDEFFGPSI